MNKVCVIRGNPYDPMVPDTSGSAGIGDWYSEGVFYRPPSTPPDVSEELQP